MKKLFYILGAALVMLASVSCEKKETVKEAQSSVEKADMTFKAVPAGTARTTVLSDGTTVVWSDGDAIKVFANGAEEGDVCEMISEAGNTYAEFGGQCAAQGPWTAICPAYSEAKLINGAIEFTMPDEQDYADNTFAQGAMPCVAYSETTEFTFNHSFGVLKLSLKLASGKTGSVKSIKVTTKGSEKLNGTFAVSPKTSAKATKSGADGTNDITLNCGSGVELGTTAKDFWIVVPAGAFASGFDVEITATDDKVATLSTDKNNTIIVGEIKPMPEMEIEFVTPAPPTRPACQSALDADANWVTIGSQQWLKVNTKCIEYDTESEAFEASWLTDNTIPTSSSSVNTPYYTDPTIAGKPAYMSDEQFANLGMQYNWAAAVGLEDGESQESEFTEKRQGICPNGSHVPSYAEWVTLGDELGGTFSAGKKMKTSTGWYSGTGEGDNGFAALPAGKADGSSVSNVGKYAEFWTATPYESNSANAYYRNLGYLSNTLSILNKDKLNVCSVRCLRD